jgi:hypothetical protein
VVTYEEGAALAAELGMPFIETSAKSADNVREAFVQMATSLMKVKMAEGGSGGDEKKPKDVDLDDANGGKKGGGGKCC